MEYFQLGATSQHDFEAQRQLLESMSSRAVFGDKAFCEKHLKEKFKDSGGELLTPVKYKKGQNLADKQRHKAVNDLFSKAVSKVRQSIESFFNWLMAH